MTRAHGLSAERSARPVALVTGVGRTGTPQDTADLVEFPCSPRGGWINGRPLSGDGGISAPS